MAGVNLLSYSNVLDGLIDVTENVEVIIDVRNGVGWGFDVEIQSSDAAGVFSLYSQYADPAISAVLTTEDLTETCAFGLWSADNTKRLVVDSNNLFTRSFLRLFWLPDASPGTGFLKISGLLTIRG